MIPAALDMPSNIESHQMINVQYTHGDLTPAGVVAFDAFESLGNAYPTSRLLDGSSDHGFAEEWAEPGCVLINGELRPAQAIYLFTADEINSDANRYPWDAAHVARILLLD
jgi:hypothetical protein